MMKQDDAHGWQSPWVRWSIVSLIAVTIGAFFIGFVWLPSAHGDFGAKGLWDSICRAAGAPASWSSSGSAVREAGGTSTDVVLDRAMAREGSRQSVGRGATLALNCTMCHGAQGMSTSDAPNLAGQYPEVIIKQLMDYRSGRRDSAIMEALAKRLSDEEIRELADYYAYLPKARTAPTTYDETLPALVRVGAPLRNIAPCVSCHGGIDQKFGAPWLEGMPKGYVQQELRQFRSGQRGNDPEGVMRNVARAMTDQEIEEVATFYAGKGLATGER
jgi:cytochrome c553